MLNHQAHPKNQNSPTVSIIMNCYNNATTLYEALQGVYIQTFKDIEIIFWDNGSSDRSLDIAKGFAIQDKNFHIFEDPERISLGHSRNNALAKASGKYIAFLDCDDTWLATKLEKQVAMLDANLNLALVCTDTENFTNTKSLGRVFASTTPHRGQVFQKLILGQWITMSSVMLRSENLKNCYDNQVNGQFFDPSLTICEEAELFYRLAQKFDFDYVDEVLTKRRVHEHNTTFNRFEELAAETEYILEKQYTLYANFGTKYADVVQILKRRAAFQHSIALWRKGQATLARATLTPYKNNLKEGLFHLITFLPPSIFPYCVRIYLRFAKYLRQ